MIWRGVMMLLLLTSARGVASATPAPRLHRMTARTMARACTSASRRCQSPVAALHGAGNLHLTPPSDSDRRAIEERQLGHKTSNLVGCGARCKHGFPQAFAHDPVGRAPWVINGREYPRKTKLESGLFRLSCPLLVEAIDAWEAEGAVRAVNKRVSLEPDLAADLHTAHGEHAAARKQILGDRLSAVLEEADTTGPESRRIADMVLDSGIAGQTRTKVDIKCVHAQVADHLCRSKSNGVGAELLRQLEARGIDIEGNDACHHQCNPEVPEAYARSQWWYEPAKNKCVRTPSQPC